MSYQWGLYDIYCLIDIAERSKSQNRKPLDDRISLNPFIKTKNGNIFNKEEKKHIFESELFSFQTA